MILFGQKQRNKLERRCPVSLIVFGGPFKPEWGLFVRKHVTKYLLSCEKYENYIDGIADQFIQLPNIPNWKMLSMTHGCTYYIFHILGD